MPADLRLQFCQYLLREAQAAIRAEGALDVEVRALPRACSHVPANSPPGSPVDAVRIGDGEIFVGACPHLHHSGRPGRATGNCFSLLAPQPLIDMFLSQGAYVVTPGWLAAWRSHLADLGFDQPIAREFFKEGSRKITLLDSQVAPEVSEQLREMGEYLDLPVESVPVGIEHFRLSVHEVIQDWRLHTSEERLAAVDRSASQKIADHALALDLAAKLARKMTEEEALLAIQESCSMLFGARKVWFQREGTMTGGEASLDDGQEYREGAQGFVVRVSHRGETLGLLFVDEVALPERRREYLNLALGFVSVCGLAIANARAAGALRETEQALRVAIKEAETANEAKGSFLANMSHEIRTPMNAVIGLANLALKTELTYRQRDYVSKIHGAGISLLGIINDILDYSKIEAGRLELERVDFTLDEVMESVNSMAGQNAVVKGLELVLNVAPDVPQRLSGDPHRLQQVLINLVGNAMKFTEKGEVELKVVREETTGEKVQLRFSVRDTGLGMTEDQASRLFRPFAQADSSTTRRYGGTGLGLSIVRRLVELMSGQIWVSSAIGAGSTFSFTAWFGAGSKMEWPAYDLPGTLAGMRVLVADDNAVARGVMSDMLRSLRFRVSTAGTGEDAVQLLQRADGEEPFGLVLMDWKMPGMDGIEATRLIVKGGLLQNVPRVLMLSASGGGEGERGKAVEAGAADFLAKPVTGSTLFDAIVRIFAPSQVRTRVGMPDETAARELKGARALLVEDNEINQQIAVELLRSEGMEVTVAGNGREALELLADNKALYDMVLMDVQMPEMDGYEAARQIRARGLTDLPIIAMTAHALMEERQKALAAGMNDHIAKPIDPPTMFEVLSHYFRKTRQPALPSVAPDAPRTAFPVMDGVNAAAALKRLAGNERLYRSLLQRFVDEQEGCAAEILEALDQHDSDRATTLAHKLNGIAGNLGVEVAHRRAVELESRLRAKDTIEECREATANLDAALRAAASAIRSALDHGNEWPQGQ